MKIKADVEADAVNAQACVCGRFHRGYCRRAFKEDRPNCPVCRRVRVGEFGDLCGSCVRPRGDLGRAFVLGNGPTLPVDELHKLDGEVTAGVNRIGLIYRPSVLFWADKADRWDPEGIHTSLNCFRASARRKDVKSGRAHVYLRGVGNTQPMNQWKPDEVYIHGSSAGAMARWLYTLGYAPIYLLGMSGEGSHFYEGGYEPKKHHRAAWRFDAAVLREQLAEDAIWIDTLEGIL